MRAMLLPTVGLTRPQIAVVAAVFVFTLIGAVIVALVCRWWNVRKTRRSSP